MGVEPLESLAFAMQANRGAYALLVGSGVSRAAGILTGWEIALDLARRLAATRSEDPGSDPAEWYQKSFGRPLDYSVVLDELVPGPADRASLLRGYFEPTEDERREGKKVPSKAHYAIADLVAAGYVEAIITTNFDRLIETAIAAKASAPVVIATPDGAAGAPPVGRERCTVLKVHGDYLDERIKNTPAELSTFDPRIDALLDRIFDERGLVVCGWSADWDRALRDAVTRCKNRRYSAFWTVRGTTSAMAGTLIAGRGAQPIRIKDADTFFVDLHEKVVSIGSLRRPHPTSVAVAVETLKRHIANPQDQIRLHDLIVEEVERVAAVLPAAEFATHATGTLTIQEISSRVERYESLTETMRHLLANGTRWGGPQHHDIWMTAIGRIANADQRQTGDSVLVALRLYPVLLLAYAAGLGFVASGDYPGLAKLLLSPLVREVGGKKSPLVNHHLLAIVDSKLHARILPSKSPTPLHDHLYALLREPFRRLVLDDADFEEMFDRFEYLWALTYAVAHQAGAGHAFGPYGRFLRRYLHWPESAIGARLRQEVEQEQAEWVPLRAGLLGGASHQQVAEIIKRLDRLFEQSAMMREVGG